MLHQFGSYADINIAAFDIYKNNFRVIIEKSTYKYEKNPIAAIMGEPTGRIPGKSDFIEIQYDIGQMDKNQIKKIKTNKFLTIKKRSGHIQLNTVRDQNIVLFSDRDDAIRYPNVIYSLFNIEEKKLLKRIISDDPFGGKMSYNFSKVYYFKSKEVFLYDIDKMSEEVLPHSAYSFLKGTVGGKAKATDMKNIFIYQSVEGLMYDEYKLIDIATNRTIGRLAINSGEVIKDIFNDDKMLFLVSDSLKGFYIRDLKGKELSNLELKEAFMYQHAILHNKVYLIRFCDTREHRRRSDGYIECIVWNYEKNEVRNLNFSL